MDKFNVVPLLRVENIPFGASKEMVRYRLGKHTEFKKSPFSSCTTDNFGGVNVYYDENNKCEAFEFFPEIKVEIGGSIIFPGRIDAMFKLFGQFDLMDGIFINFNKSIGIIATNGKMESIIFGKKDYYKWLNKN